MDFITLEKDIIEGICNIINHISEKNYWYDINSFCLYTDEWLMSLSLLFNTNKHYQSVKGGKYPLTYKYSPAEWFSETISINEDQYLYEGTAFSHLSAQLLHFSMSDEFEENRGNIVQSCLNAIRYCIDEGIFKKGKSTVYLFMMSDGYDENEMLCWNKSLNEYPIINELTEWVEREL
ncbi:DUF4303 domain-containing protein [Xenorhabdus sp. ZM]|uniref:DUF4303 domain-containing protein n=1 Tax=Xenorhabdus szentirmaii TaxID=290112 RepID=UPI001988C053|nr:DUF4303 domain-containing protein [Xenorhabdus sp. ZM]MBD2806961.1 DUF4303 domain-containing protein [Xenorhabdus sp. ZM]